jgi:RNA polymerase I-specific transcription initiation factor RRN3
MYGGMYDDEDDYDEDEDGFDDEDDEEDDEEDEDDDDLIEEGPIVDDWDHEQGGLCIPITTSKRGESDDDGLGASFGGMSISPAHTRTAAMAISAS